MKKTIKFVALMLMLSLFLIGCEPPIETLRIKFDSNGGSTIYPRYEKPGSKLDCPIPIKEGYFLEGWYTSLDGGETLDRKWIFETDTITGELFLYAKWEENYPNIYFINDGLSFRDITQKLGEKIEAPLAPFKEGYFLEGWYTSLDGGETLDRKWIFETDTITGELFLYAKWEENYPNIFFNSKGGSSVSDITQKPGEKIEAPVAPVKTGYEFAGWYSDRNLENYYIFDTMPDEDIYLYAAWGTAGLTYTLLNDDTYGVSKGTVFDKKIVIPDRHQGKLVTSIVANAFMDYKTSTNIVISSYVTSIGERAFSNCYGLTGITIPKSITSIGERAFYGCSNLTIYAKVESKPTGWVDDWNPSYRPVVFGYISNQKTKNGFEYGVSSIDSVYSVVLTRYIGISAKVIIPETIEGYKVTKIGNSTFYNCTYVTNVTISKNIDSIGSRVFVAVNTKTIFIPKNVLNIDSSAFGSCSNLAIYVEATSKPAGWATDWNDHDRPVVFGYISNRTTENGFEYGVSLIDSEYSVVLTRYIGKAAEVIIPETIEGYKVTKIGSYAFHGNQNLTQITITNNITSIGTDTFSYCSNLTSIYIPDSVIDIGASAFKYCTSLTNIDLPKNITYISQDTFSRCTSLTNIVIPESVTIIGSSAFTYCENLTSINIPKNLTSISDYVFWGCGNLANVIIPNGVTSIGIYAFSDCTSFTSISVPDSVLSIGRSAFSDCTGLTNIKLSSNIIEIGDRAFTNCISLRSIVIPGSTIYMGKYVFMICNNLTIYSETIRKPDGWHEDWSYANNTVVVWGYGKD